MSSKRKGIGGRRSKLTPELSAQICAFVRDGLPESTASELCGVSHDTVMEWLQRARGNSDRPARPEHVQFAQDLRQAIAASEQQLIGVIHKAATGYFVKKVERTTSEKDGTVVKRTREKRVDWTAAAWLLERRFAHRYSPKAEIKHSGEVASVKRIILAGPDGNGAMGLPADIAGALAKQQQGSG